MKRALAYAVVAIALCSALFSAGVLFSAGALCSPARAANWKA